MFGRKPPFETINEYIKLQPAAIQTKLRKLRDVIKEYLDCTSTVVNNGFNEIPETKQVTVSVRLNLREEPLRTAPIVQVLQPGTQLTYSARITNGEPVNANPVWFKDNNGNFFWSGGVLSG